MKMTSAYANKILKSLDEQKDYLLSMESDGHYYVVTAGETPEIVPDYDYRETAAALEKIDRQIAAIKHAINLSNTTAVLTVGEEEMTVDVILVRMAQLNKRKKELDMLRKMQPGRADTSLFAPESGRAQYRYLNFDVSEVKKDFQKISQQIMTMQLALDRHNQIDEFEVDIAL